MADDPIEAHDGRGVLKSGAKMLGPERGVMVIAVEVMSDRRVFGAYGLGFF